MASASEDKLADLSGAELVAHLSNSYLRADFEAVARILVTRDRRDAKVEAELTTALADLDAASALGGEAAMVKVKLEEARAGVEALREKYRALLDAFLPPRYKVEEMAPMVGAAASDAVHRDESRIEEAKEGEAKGINIIDLSSDDEEEGRAAGGYEEEDKDEEDTESLSQRIKRLKGDKLEELEMVSKPKDSKVAVFMQESPLVKIAREMSNTPVQVKREMTSLPSTITSEWDSEGHMVISLLEDENVEVNMQALCALYRQGMLTTEDKRSECRAIKLADFLLDGDRHGPMKRTAEELKKRDVTNVPFLQLVTSVCSKALFGIFRSKEDPYFC